MPYADSDFFLALLKPEDWLGKNAERILEEHRGRIWTSQWTLVEILMLVREYKLDPETVVSSIGQLAVIEGGIERFLAVASLMKERGMTVFDALHAISCSHESIISSDRVFDELGLQRIRLEGN